MAAKDQSKPEPFTCTQKVSYGEEVLHNLSTLLKEDKYTDFEIVIHDFSIRCHRVVLAATCPYFSALLTSGMKEAGSGRVNMTHSLTHPVITTILQYLYGADITVEWDTVKEVVEAAEMLQLTALKESLAAYICNHVTLENCIGLWKLSQKFQLDDVGNKARHLMVSQIEHVSKTDEFKSLELAEVIDYIRTKDVSMPNLDPILIACIEWVDYEPISRKDTVLDLFKHIEVEKCTSLAIKTVLKKYQDLLINPSVMKLLLNAVLSKMEAAEQPFEIKIIICGGSANFNSGAKNNTKCWMTKSCTLANPAAEILDIPSMYSADRAPIVTLPTGLAIFCGGPSFTKNRMYNAVTKTWKELPDLPVPIKWASALFYKNTFYILGGETLDQTKLDGMYYLNIDEKVWKLSTMLEKGRWPHAAWYHPTDHLYAVMDASQNLQSYSLVDGKWQFKAGVPVDQATHGAYMVNYEDYMYMIGGIGMCARYDVRNDNWTVLKPSSTHYFPGALVVGCRIVVFGGITPENDIVDVYDIVTNKWSRSPFKLPEKLSFTTISQVDWL